MSTRRINTLYQNYESDRQQEEMQKEAYELASRVRFGTWAKQQSGRYKQVKPPPRLTHEMIEDAAQYIIWNCDWYLCSDRCLQNEAYHYIMEMYFNI